MEPITVPPPEQIASRLPPAAQKDLLEWNSGFNTTNFIQLVSTHEYTPPDLSQMNPDISITDDRPFNEYFLLRAWHVINYGDATQVQ